MYLTPFLMDPCFGASKACQAGLDRRSFTFRVVKNGSMRSKGDALATFTIYLLREAIKRAEDGLVEGAVAHEIREGESAYGTLYVKQTRPRAPKWAEIFDDYVER